MTSDYPHRVVDAPLSFAQEGLWLIEQMFPELQQFVLMRAFRLRGEVDAAALSRAVGALGARHETLRTTFVVVDGSPRQRVRADLRLQLQQRDLRGTPDPLNAARQITEESSALPFDLATGPPMRAILLRLADDDNVLILAAHHIVIDLWSWPTLLADLSELAAAEQQGRTPKLAEIQMGTTDYARWQRSRMDDPEVRAQLDHWRRELEGVPSLVSLPADRRHPPGPSRGGGVLHAPLTPDLAAALDALGKAEGATVAMITLAALGALLARYTREQVVTIGLPVAGDRHRPEVEHLVGMFVNVLPAKVDLRRDPTFRMLVQQAKMSVFDVLVNQDVPYELLVRTSAPGGAAGVMHYEQVSVNVRYPEPDALTLGPVAVSEFPGGRWFPPGDLTLTVDVGEDRTDMVWIYDDTLFDRAMIAGLARQFQAMLADGVTRPDIPVSGLQVSPPGWRAAPAAVQPAPAGTVVSRFTDWVRRTPGALAVVHGNHRMTYAELDRRACEFAVTLRRLGVRRETPVGVCMDRSPDLIAAYLGVLKAGGAYLPIEPEYPAHRQNEMLSQAGATIVICGGGPRDVPWPPSVRQLDPRAAEISELQLPPLPAPAPPQALAYVMFTSGSTGTPKGVAVTHRGVVGLVVEANYVQVSPGDRVAHTSGVCSDITTFELWAPLLNGASVHIVDRDLMLSPVAFGEFLTGQGITILSVPAALINHSAYLAPLAAAPLRTLHFGGEAGRPAAARALLDAGFRGSLVHAYGPTETTMLASSAVISDVRPDRIRLPVGHPVSATEVYVMDELLRPVPPGMPGELCVAGDRLARGYLARPGLTAERFCPNPVPGRDGQLMYRTGDLGRQLPDGQFQVLGRLDRQVKLHGFRVEPAEVEQVLAGCPDIAQAAVVARPGPGGDGTGLAAYVTALPGTTVSVRALREELSRRLPAYMVPSAIVPLPQLPLTASGKVDQRALPLPGEADLTGAELHYSLDSREHLVAAAMRDLLGMPAIGRDDNFFALGGHSLLAVQLIDELRRSGLDVPMGHLLSHPTVSGVARWAEPDAADQAVLILVHGGGGGVGAYAPFLTEIGDRYRSVLLEAREPGSDSITDLAAGYLEQVRPALSGPAAVLAGWSVGGAIAHEMARQWQGMTGSSKPVLMIDTWPGQPPGAVNGNALSAFVYDLVSSAGAPLPAFPADGADPAQALSAVLAELRHISGFGRLDLDQLLARFAVFRRLSAAIADYRPHRYDGPVTLIEAASSPPKQAAWAPFCTQLRIVELPGDHYSVLRKAAPALADLGGALLGRADGRSLSDHRQNSTNAAWQ